MLTTVNTRLIRGALWRVVRLLAVVTPGSILYEGMNEHTVDAQLQTKLGIGSAYIHYVSTHTSVGLQQQPLALHCC